MSIRVEHILRPCRQPGLQGVDTLGAGDAFVAVLLVGLGAEPGRTAIRDEQALRAALSFANAVGAIATTRYDAIPALPTRAQVEQLLDVSGSAASSTT